MIKNKVARWMVVDDSPEALDVLAKLLAESGDAEICAFPSAWQALEAFTAAPETFQLVVTDFEMPGMNGVDFRRHVQSISPSTKVLLITGGRTFTEESALQNGFCGFLNKPFTLGALQQTIHAVNRTSATL